MKTLVVGDVHGCSDELCALVHQAKADRVLLVGDLFTKGPDPLGVWQQIQKGQFESVLGNHDQRLLDCLDGKRVGDREAQRVIECLGGAGRDWEGWLRSCPLFLELMEHDVVHAGVHPDLGRKGTSRRMALNMRRWPDESQASAYWHQQYLSERGVIFGHDARNGLVMRLKEGRPWLVGLDSGCVYGGKLTGFLVEEGRLLHEKARRIYRPV